MTSDLLIRGKKGIYTITMNRPRVMNAINVEIIQGLENAFKMIASEEKIRVVILEGAEGNFCSGADMASLKEGSGPFEGFESTLRFGKVIQSMRELPQLVISKVRGVAAGFGANLALAGDFVLASHNARFIQAFVNIGLILDGGGTYFLPRLVGAVKARELALLGNVVNGESAKAMGLIYRCVSDEDLDSEVDALAGILSEKQFHVLALIKEGLEDSLNMSLAQVIDWEASHQAIMLQRSEHKEAVQKFLRSRGKVK